MCWRYYVRGKEIEKYQGFFHLNLMWILGGVIGVFLAIDILCALAPNYAVLPHYSHMAKVGFLPQFRMRAGNGCLSALRLRTIPGR